MSTNSTASKLESLQGLELAKGYVARAVRSEGLAQAVLFHGPEGSGKGSLARILAQSWMCRTPEDGFACGSCPSCQAFENGLNADLLEVSPGGKGGMIQLGMISDIEDNPTDAFPMQRFLRTLPIHSRCKVALIEGAHRLHYRAANAALKAIEEPESYTRFILTTDQLSKISATIRSRCTLVACGTKDSVGEDGLRLTPGVRAQFADRQEFLNAIRDLAIATQGNPIAALKHAETFRDLVEEAKDDDDGSARERQLDAIALLAEALRQTENFESAGLAVEAYRRVRNNGQFGIVTDALFARIGTQS